MLQIAEQRDCLQSFAQAHLISKDAVDPILMEANHPVETSNLRGCRVTHFLSSYMLYLVISHCSSLYVSWTFIKLDDVFLSSVQVGEDLLVLLLLSHSHLAPAVSHLLLLPTRLGEEKSARD